MTEPTRLADTAGVVAASVRIGPPAEDTVARLARETRERDARRAAQAARRDLDDRIPPRYRARIDLDEGVVQWVEAFIAGDTTSLVLMGPVGTGKTHQAYTALREAVTGRPVGFAAVPVPAFLDGMRPGRDGTTFDAVAGAGLLLLDDLAAERGSDWTIEVLYRLIDYRWAWNLPTIITTNVGAGALEDHLGTRITSRLRGMARVVTVLGEDRRRPPS